MGNFDLDLLIREIGPFGKYQLVNYLLLCIPIAWTTMFTLGYVFTAGDLSYRCKVPACDQGPEVNPLQSDYLNFTIPVESSGKWSRCQVYKYYKDANASDEVSTCRPENFDTTVLEECHEFSYQSDEKTILSEFDLTCKNEWKLAFVGTANNIGQFLCLPLTGYISDRYGRKIAFILGILLSGVFGILRVFSVNYEMFTALELLEAAFGSAVYSTGFILAMEYVDPSKRVLGTSIINTFYTFGLAALGGLAYATRDWRLLLWSLYLPCFLIIAYFWILPESTRWLVTKGKISSAQRNIQTAGQWNETRFSEAAQKMLNEREEDFMELQEKGQPAEEKEESSDYPLLAAIKNGVIFRRLLILSFCWATNTFVYYGLSIYSVSFGGDKYINYVSSTLIELPSVFITYFLVDTKLLGRKRSLMGSFFISGIACILQLTLDHDTDAAIEPLPFTLFMVGKLAITCAFVIVYVYTSELFPTELRHSLLGFCSMIGRVGSMVAPQVPLLGKLMSSLPMILFGSFAVCASALVFFLPETYNKVLPDHIADAVKIERGSPDERENINNTRDR